MLLLSGDFILLVLLLFLMTDCVSISLTAHVILCASMGLFYALFHMVILVFNCLS